MKRTILVILVICTAKIIIHLHRDYCQNGLFFTTVWFTGHVLLRESYLIDPPLCFKRQRNALQRLKWRQCVSQGSTCRQNVLKRKRTSRKPREQHSQREIVRLFSRERTPRTGLRQTAQTPHQLLLRLRRSSRSSSAEGCSRARTSVWTTIRSRRRASSATLS